MKHMPSETAAPSRSPSRLVLSDVSCSRESRPVLTGLKVDLEVTRLGIVGRNGSGKTTLARLLAGLVTPDRGTVHLDGVQVARDRKAALGLVGILFQNPDHQIIFPTVVEEIAFGLIQQGNPRPEAEDRARATLARFGKTHWESAYVNTLSQGQKHLVCLMAIAAMEPKLLILDEPFAGLDIPTKAQLMRYLDHYAGNTVHITHDPADIAGYDQVLWLDRGRVREIGAAGTVLASYVTRMTELGEADDIAELAG